MHEYIQRFLDSLQSHKHLLQLLGTKELKLQLETDDESVTLEITQSGIIVNPLNTERENLIRLQGNSDVLIELLNGKSKLRELTRLNHLRLNTTFRNVLMLESLFYLNK